MAEKTNQFIKNVLPYIIIIIVVVTIRTFIVTPIQVDGQSMYSTLEDNEILLLKKYDKSYERFDVIVFNHEEYENGKTVNLKLIKRIVGLPGDNVEYKKNKLYINGIYVKEDFLTNNQKTSNFKLKEIGYNKIPKGYYFVMGDNRTNSKDSRMIGLISKDDIEGITDFVLFPFSNFGSFN